MTDRTTGDGRLRPALIVVDVQNDFAAPGGALSVVGAAEVLPRINSLVEAATEAGWLVVYTADWHPPRTPHFVTDGGPWPVHCVAGTWGAQFHPDLVVADDALVIHKGTAGEDGYSGFTMVDAEGATASTGLRQCLSAAGVEEVVVVGLATDYCVAATARDAVDAGFDTTVVADAAAPVDVHPGDGDRALAELATKGARVTDTASVLAHVAA